MPAIDTFLMELEYESQITRRVLERVPEASLGWKPHDKSMTLGQLALHVATIPGIVAGIALRSPFTAAPVPRPEPGSAAELIPILEESVRKARKLLGGMDDAVLAGTWRMMRGGAEVLAVPRSALLRSIMLNHWYHHRGQLTVYLRQVGALVPAIYGASADEDPFVA